MSTKAAAKRLGRRVAAASLLLLLGVAGCTSVKPETAQVAAQPKTPPVRNITNFTGALQCMDGLFANWGVHNVIITSAGIPDATGEISTGTREMLISAISRMSAKSNAFRYVDYDLTQVDVQQLHQLIDSSKSFVAPNYYIRGAITQLDQGVLDGGVGFGVSAGSGRSGADIGVNFNKVVSTVSLDLNVVDFVSRQVVPGMYANTSLAVVRASKAADPSGRINKAGIFFNIALDQSEGMHQAVRTLVELNTIEVLGKLAEVPYWKCLQIESTNPAALEQARDWYHAMKPKERLTFAQRALKGAGYYAGPVDGVMNPATSEAIAAFQVDNQQIADGRIGFQLYMGLLDAGKRLAGIEPAAPQERVASVPAAAQPMPAPQTVGLTVRNAASPASTPADRLALTVETTADGYLTCYYRDGRGRISRIFPSRAQPNAYVVAGRSVKIPSDEAAAEWQLERPASGAEAVCLASARELALHLPKALRVQDAQPLPLASIDDVIAVYKTLAPAGLSVHRLPLAAR